MSSIKRDLNRLAGELKAMAEDLLQFRGQRPAADWLTEKNASHTFGDDVPISMRALAEYFLNKWLDWNETQGRWRRYFGQGDNPPRAWRKTYQVCQPLVIRLLRDIELGKAIIANLFSERMNGHIETPKKSAQWLFHQAIENHARLQLAEAFMGETPRGLDTERAFVASDQLSLFQTPPVDTGRVLHKTAEEADRILQRQFWECDPGIASLLKWHLRQYLHSTLRLSWLGGGTTGSFLESLLSRAEGDNDMFLIEELLSKDLAITNIPYAKQMLERLITAIGEIGYDRFLDDVTDDDFLGGDDSPVGTGEINIIPAASRVPCSSILLALSRGDNRRGPFGFSNIMRRTKTHLIECEPKTKLVVFICDTWNGQSFTEDHLDELSAWYRKGVRFLFLLVGSPRTELSRIAVDFRR